MKVYATLASMRRSAGARIYALYVWGEQKRRQVGELRIERSAAYTWYAVRAVGSPVWFAYALPTLDPTFRAAGRALRGTVTAALGDEAIYLGVRYDPVFPEKTRAESGHFVHRPTRRAQRGGSLPPQAGGRP